MTPEAHEHGGKLAGSFTVLGFAVAAALSRAVMVASRQEVAGSQRFRVETGARRAAGAARWR